MDARQDELVEKIHARRMAIANDLELLRLRLRRLDPRRVELDWWARRVAPVLVGFAGVMWWRRRRRAVLSLDELLVHELSDLRAAEQALVPALDRMSTVATHPELKRALEQHRLETQGHVERLDRVFRAVGASPRRGAARAVAGAVEEVERLAKRRVDSRVRDAWLIGLAQRVEHIEIASYGTARTLAATLGFAVAAQLLQDTLDEERAVGEKLARLDASDDFRRWSAAAASAPHASVEGPRSLLA